MVAPLSSGNSGDPEQIDFDMVVAFFLEHGLEGREHVVELAQQGIVSHRDQNIPQMPVDDDQVRELCRRLLSQVLSSGGTATNLVVA